MGEGDGAEFEGREKGWGSCGGHDTGSVMGCLVVVKGERGEKALYIVACVLDCWR